MGILAIIPGLLRMIYGPHRALGLGAMFGFLVLYILCFPLALILHFLNAGEELALVEAD